MFQSIRQVLLNVLTWIFGAKQTPGDACGTPYHERINELRHSDLYRLSLIGEFGVADVMRIRKCCDSTASSWLRSRVRDKTVVRTEPGRYRVV